MIARISRHDVDVGLSPNEAKPIDFHHASLPAIASHDIDVQARYLCGSGIEGVRHGDRVGKIIAFEAVLEAYKRSPEVTRRRIYLETMQGVLPGIRRKVVLDSDLKGLLPLLNLSEEVKTP